MSQINEKIDLILDKFDELFRTGNFEETDRELRALELGRLSESELITYLTATRPAKDKLPSRQRIYSEIQILLENRGYESRSILDGLE